MLVLPVVPVCIAPGMARSLAPPSAGAPGTSRSHTGGSGLLAAAAPPDRRDRGHRPPFAALRVRLELLACCGGSGALRIEPFPMRCTASLLTLLHRHAQLDQGVADHQQLDHALVPLELLCLDVTAPRAAPRTVVNRFAELLPPPYCPVPRWEMPDVLLAGQVHPAAGLPTAFPPCGHRRAAHPGLRGRAAGQQPPVHVRFAVPAGYDPAAGDVPGQERVLHRPRAQGPRESRLRPRHRPHPARSRQHRRRSSSPAAGARCVAIGRLLGVYPEGTRSPDGRLYRGKTGAARIALPPAFPSSRSR